MQEVGHPPSFDAKEHALDLASCTQNRPEWHSFSHGTRPGFLFGVNPCAVAPKARAALGPVLLQALNVVLCFGPPAFPTSVSHICLAWLTHLLSTLDLL